MLTDLGFADLEVWYADIQTTKRILNQLSDRNGQARKFLDVINRLCPEPADNGNSPLMTLPWQQPESWRGLRMQDMDFLSDKWPAFIG